MKYLFITVLVMVGLAGSGQVVGELRPYDSTRIFVHGTKPETFNASKFIQPIGTQEFRLNLDSIKKVNLELYNYWMRLLGRDTIPICRHIYVAVESDTVLGDAGGGTDAVARVGFHDGKEVVCVKCRHVKNQIIDYNWRFGQGSGITTRRDTTYVTGSGYKLFWHPDPARMTVAEKEVIIGTGSHGRVELADPKDKKRLRLSGKKRVWKTKQ
jgi:hypothetical protein